jgi:hypothetical protein
MSGARAKRSDSPTRKSANRATKASDSSVKKTSPKVVAFIRKHWPAAGRAERIARAERAWKEAMEIASTFKRLDPETVKWIAEDPNLEYL